MWVDYGSQAAAADVVVERLGGRPFGLIAELGVHPGGGHFTLLGRLAGREAAAAISVFGSEVSGARAAELGLAWEATAADDVLPRALDLARGPAKDPELARQAILSLRRELDAPGLAWPVAVEMERGTQMWSLRRRHDGG